MITRFNLEPLQKYLTDGYTLLVPNQRIRDALLCACTDSSVTKSFYTPDINAVDIWMTNLWQRLASQGRSPFSHLRLLGSLEESLIWTDIVEQDQRNTSLLNIDETAASAQQAYQLYRLWLDDGSNPASLPSASGLAELNLFAQWCRLFSDHCGDRQLITLADATHLLVRELGENFSDAREPSAGICEKREQNFVRHVVPDKIVAVNFYQAPPLYQKLLELLVTDRQRCTIQTAILERPVTGQCHVFVDSESETRACLNWAREVTASDPNAHVGIVVADDYQSQSRIERLLQDTFNPAAFSDLYASRPLVNGLTFSGPILEQKLIGDALLLLNLANPDQDTADFCQLVQSPGLSGYEQEIEARISLEHYIRDNLGTRCETSRLLHIMSNTEQPYHCPVLAATLLELSNQTRSQRKGMQPAEWADTFAAQLDTLGWPGPGRSQDKTRRNLLNSWQQVLKCFAGHRPASGVMSRQAAISRLRNLCRKTASPAPFDAGNAISLYRLNDAAGLEFTHTWFLGFSDQSLPAPPNPSPFLVHREQREARIPGSHSDVQLQLANSAFKIICQSTSGELRASYHLSDGDQHFRPASLIDEFPVVVEEAGASQALNNLAASGAADVRLELFTDDQIPALRSDEKPGGGQQLFSDQSRCPFRAFASHRLQARPLEPLTNGLDARTRGIAIHIALEQLFTKVTDSYQLSGLSSTQIFDLVSGCTDKAIEYLAWKRPDLMSPRFSSIERQRVQRLLEEYLEIEKQRKPFQVLDTEKSLGWQIEDLQINLKIDRIDRLADQSLAIIDYKTGKSLPSINSLAEERPENLQLPVYYCAVAESLGHSADTIVFAQISTGNVKFQGLTSEENFHANVRSIDRHREFNSDWATVTGEWREKIGQLAGDFSRGVARVDPAHGKKTCDTCSLQALCRIRQLEPLQQYQNDEESMP